MGEKKASKYSSESKQVKGSKLFESIRGFSLSLKKSILILLISLFVIFSLFLMLSFNSNNLVGESTHELDYMDSISDLCDSPVEAQNYLIAFNSCSHEDCDNPSNHEIFLAGSDDGEEWELIEEFDNGHMGSVPDIVYYNDYIYLFHTSSEGDHNYDVLDKCFNIVDTGTVFLEGGDEDGWVDPSLIIDDDELVLFYLPGVKGQDPAMCPEDVESCTKEIHSARSSLSTLPLFQLVLESRVEAELNTKPDSGAIISFSDPDIIQLEDGSYLLYVSSGSNSLVYVGSDLDGSFESPSDDGELVFASEKEGGVPSAVQDLSTGDVWLYVHKDDEDGNRIIKRAVSDGITELSSSDFKTVIDDDIFVDSDNYKSFSPSIIRWADDILVCTEKDCLGVVLGDLDGSGSINAADAITFTNAFKIGTPYGDADLDDNGFVNWEDIKIFLGIYLKS